ncbi:MAG: hypothetical protein WCO57_11485 [Verrucomicrobiota bacterium]
MLTPRLLGIAALGLLCGACGKIRELAGKAKQAAENRVSATLGSDKTAADPALQALVDQTPEGAVFRKDLVFPEHLQVKETRLLKFDAARVFVKSAFGNQAAALSGTRHFTTLYERAGERVSVTMESAGFALPEVDNPQGVKAKVVTPKGDKAAAQKVAADKAAALAAVPHELAQAENLTGGKVSFLFNGKAWKATHTSDFKLAVWSGRLESSMGANCMDVGIMPRAHWFGKGRLKPGDSVPLSGASMALLFAGGATGTATLKLESFEVSGGHPCGVFAVTGNYRAAAMPGPDGEVADCEVSISSGKVWLSLVYPVVIREQLETVQTLVTGTRGGLATRIQGKVAVAITREWKATPSTP